MKYLLIFIQLFTIVFAQTNNTFFNEFLKDEQLKPANVSFLVFDTKNNKSKLAYNNEKLMIPASVQKLITTSAALNILGEKFVYNTKINFNGIIVDNKFKGIIEIIASGDPTLDKTLVDELYSFIKSKNINSIEGFIPVNEDIFDKTIPKTWLVEDIANYYGTPAFAFNYLKNTYKISFTQTTEGFQPKINGISPKVKLSFDNQLISGAENSGDHAYIIGLPFSNKRQIVGTIPAGTGVFSIKGAINNPEQIFKNDVISKFKNENFTFIFNPKVKEEKTILSYSHKSKKLIEIINETNKKSINLYAEALLKTIGHKQFGFGTTENGLKAIKQYYSNEEIIIYDGSGMSRKDLITANFVNTVLLNNKDNVAFKNTLGVSGISGTMKYFKSEKTKGKIYAKSGSADNILNYAGYFKNLKGEEFSFVIFINSYIGDRKVLRKKIVALMENFL